MRKSLWLAPALVLGLAAPAWAQQGLSTDKGRTDTVKVTVLFDADVDFVVRMVGLSTALGINDSTQSFEANARVGFNVELTEKISFLISFANERVNGSGPATLGDGLTPEIWDLQIRIAELFNPALTVTIGTHNDLAYDVRGNGHSFYAPGHGGSFGRNAQTDETVNVGGYISQNVGDWFQPTGVVFAYNTEDLNFGVALLPAIQEGGTASDDEAAYFLWLYYNLKSLGKGSRIGALVATNAYSGDLTGVRTISVGASLKDLGMKNLEIFAEIYIQNGDAGRFGTDAASAKGQAIYIGGNFLVNAENNTWLELSFTRLSGDGDDSVSLDDTVDSFLSFDNVNDLLIIEGDVFGLNWSSNLQAIKIMGGMSFTSGSMKNNVSVTVVLGLCSTVEDVGAAPNETSTLGTEIDIKVVYWHSKAVATEINLAILSGSDVLELATGGPGGDSENSTQLLTIGWTIKG